jgi:hypothetical protein
MSALTDEAYAFVPRWIEMDVAQSVVLIQKIYRGIRESASGDLGKNYTTTDKNIPLEFKRGISTQSP